MSEPPQDGRGAGARPAPADPDAFKETRYDVRCARCGTVGEVPDTGERPLRYVCPGCGTEGDLPLPPPSPRRLATFERVAKAPPGDDPT